MFATRHPAVPYVAPFAAYISFLMLDRLLPFPADVLYVARFVVVAIVILAFSRPLISFRAKSTGASILLGLLVFAIWVAPDILWPGYRSHWLFTNAITGSATSSLPPHARIEPWFLALRAAGSIILVPVLEELFWRGWLIRWLQNVDFLSVPLGAWSAQSFWIATVLFASEHGPYWDVGLVAGALYNLLLLRTRSLADCILAHAVTNAALAGYVIATGSWQYWL